MEEHLQNASYLRKENEKLSCSTGNHSLPFFSLTQVLPPANCIVFF